MTDPAPPDQPPSSAVRVLLVTEYFPATPQAVFGAFQRLRAHLSALCEVGLVDVAFLWPEGRLLSDHLRSTFEQRARDALGPLHEVSFVSVGLRRGILDRIGDLRWAWHGAIGFFQQKPTMRTSGRSQAQRLRSIITASQPNLIFAHRIGSGAALLRAGTGDASFVLDMDDIEHVALDRLAASSTSFWRRLRVRLRAQTGRFAERRIMTAARAVLVCSEIDRGKLLALSPHANVHVAPNTGKEFADLRSAASPVAAFVGIAHYPPNREAMLWLMNDIWPIVIGELPEARLQIVGEGSEQLPLPAGVSGIELLGFTFDLAPIYESARISVCPVRRGGGTRIKIIEAALNRRPVVSTRIGAEGLEFREGSEILLADDAVSFARCCIDLLRHGDRATSIGEAARRRALELYSSDRTKTALTDLCRKYLARR